VSRIAKLVHLLGLVLFLGSIFTFAVASGVPASGDLPSLATVRRVISAGTTSLTLPGLFLLVASGAGLLRGRARLVRQAWLRVMLVAGLVIVANALLVVVPAVRSATSLAQEAVAAGQRPAGYARAYAVESAAGAANIVLALLATAAGVWRFGANDAERPIG
jgi:hypothetical protein